MARTILFWTMLLLATGSCRKIKENSISRMLDQQFFSLTGHTIFTRGTSFSLKDIHLDGNLLVGKAVKIKGGIYQVGDLSTHLVLKDEQAQMLVDLSKTSQSASEEQLAVGKTINILGEVHIGSKGHVYIVAKSLHFL